MENYLLNRTLRLEENPPAEQFPEYAANGPHIHSRGVVPCAHQDLRGSVDMENCSVNCQKRNQ